MLNNVILQGRLVADPDARHTNSGVPLASFRLAVERNIKSADGKRESDFINCTAWRQTAEFVVKHFHRGDMILLTGRLQSHSWETDAGEKRNSTDVQIDSVFFAGGKNGNQGTPPAAPAALSAFPAAPAGFSALPDEDEIPF